MPIRTSTTVRSDVFEDIQYRGWKISELVLLGYEVRKGLVNFKTSGAVTDVLENVNELQEVQKNLKQRFGNLNYTIQQLLLELAKRGVNYENIPIVKHQK